MPELRPSEKRGEPLVALFLNWFLPGAGHAYLGRFGRAAVIFAAVLGLYAIGFALSDGRVFEFLDPELRGGTTTVWGIHFHLPFATILTPEMGNLGALIFQHKTVGYGTGEPIPFPRYVELGGILTGLAGVLNIFGMVDAHLCARTPAQAPRKGRHPVVLLIASWAFPGLGHYLQGRRKRALIVCLVLLGLFLSGTLMAEGANLSRVRHFYYWSGQFFLGGPAIIAELLSGHPPVTSEMPLGDAGLLYACMPGLLNILAMLDVFGVAERRWLKGEDPLVSAAVEADPST